MINHVHSNLSNYVNYNWRKLLVFLHFHYGSTLQKWDLVQFFGLMLDLGLLKIIYFPLFIAHAGGSNSVGPYPYSFPKHAGQS